MPLIRGHHSFDDHFTQIPNAWLRDPNISLGAKGLLAQLLSHSPGWTISQESLGAANRIGKDAIRTLIGELLSAGYLNRSTERTRLDKGYLGGYTYTTQDPSMADYPTLDKPTLDEPPLKKNIIKEEQVKEEYPQIKFEVEFEKFWKLYPKKVEKIDAQKAFLKAITFYGLDEIMAGVIRLAHDPNLPPRQYIPYPASWLNSGAWTNEPYPPRELTAEEKAEKTAKERQLKLDRDKQRTREMLAEQSTESAPSPTCLHGNKLISCLKCLRVINDRDKQ